MTRSSLVRFLLLGLIWGGSNTFIKVSLRGLEPGQLVLARLVLGAAVLLGVLAVRRGRLPTALATWAHLAVTAVLGLSAPFLLLAWGEQRTSAAAASVLLGATPVLTLAVATLVLPAERGGWRRAAGLLAGFAGVVLVLSPWRIGSGSLAGPLACVGAAASYALQAVYARRFLTGRGVSPLVSSATQVTIAAVLQAAVTSPPGWRALADWPVAASIVVLGVVGTGVGYLFYYRLIDDVGATTASAVNYLVPVAGVLIGVVTLAESVSWNVILGAAVVLVSLAFAEGRVGRPRSGRPQETVPHPAMVEK